MPQLIAMVIVVVGAMIYMFQTFGGTGDKIEGIAQKTSIITEINNIKDGLKIAAKSEHIAVTASGDSVDKLEGLATLSYFAEQINDQLTEVTTLNTVADDDSNNTYNAISFGGTKINGSTTTQNDSDLQISMVNDKVGMVPGIFIDLAKGGLSSNVAFLEAQIANDLSAIATIDRTATSATSGTLASGDRIPGPAATSTTALTSDGMFTIYFKDFGSDEVVK